MCFAFQNGSFQTAAPRVLYQGDISPTPPLDALFELVSSRADSDGIADARMFDGSFIDFGANFNLNFTQSCTIGGTNELSNRSEWLNLSGSMTLLGMSTNRRRRHKLH
jgi:hypothetical protein